MSVRSDQLLISAQSNTVEYIREIPILINVNLETHFIAEYVVPIESLGFANADFTMIIAVSSVVPQKLQTAESLTSAYGIQYRNISIATISNETFADLTGEPHIRESIQLTVTQHLTHSIERIHCPSLKW